MSKGYKNGYGGGTSNILDYDEQNKQQSKAYMSDSMANSKKEWKPCNHTHPVLLLKADLS